MTEKSQDNNLAVTSLREEFALAAWRNDVNFFMKVAVSSVDACLSDGSTALHLAAAAGSNEAVIWLLEHGAQINRLTNSGASPLLLAVKGEFTSTVAILLQYGADPNLSTLEDCSTPLFIACCYGFVPIVKLLVGHPRINVDLCTKSGVTPLMVAAQNGQVEVCKVLCMNQNININSTVQVGNRVNEGRPYYHWRPVECRKMIMGTASNIASWWKKRLQLQAPSTRETSITLALKDACSYPVTPLLLAAQNGHHSVVRLLLDKGATVTNSPRTAPQEPWTFRSKLKPPASGMRVTRRKRTSSIDDCRSPVHFAVAFGNFRTVRELLASHFQASETHEEFKVFVDSLIAFKSRLASRGPGNLQAEVIRATLLVIRSFTSLLHFSTYYLDPKATLEVLREGADIFQFTRDGMSCEMLVQLGINHLRDWQRAESTSILEAGDCQARITLKIVLASELSWIPQRNWLWPKSFQKTVAPFIVSMRRLKIPRELVLETLMFCSRNWFEVECAFPNTKCLYRGT